MNFLSQNSETVPPLEVRIVDQDSSKDLQCGICLQILGNPKQCKNGHMFCSPCITAHLSKKEECPTCRCTLRESELARNLFVERHLRNLKIFCKYRYRLTTLPKSTNPDWIEDENGCVESFTTETVIEHEKLCPFGFVPCKYSLKCEGIRRKTLLKHEQVCPFRPLECVHCKTAIEFSKMEVGFSCSSKKFSFPI